MKLRTLVITSVVAVLAIGGVAFFIGYRQTHRYDPVTLAEVQVHNKNNGKNNGKAGRACMKGSNSFRLSQKEQQSIADAATGHIKDLPSDTKATLSVASYHAAKHATGTVSFDKNRGDYNFELQEHKQYWRVTSFQACDR